MNAARKRLERLESRGEAGKRVLVTKLPAGLPAAQKDAYVAAEAERLGVTERDIHVVIRRLA